MIFLFFLEQISSIQSPFSDKRPWDAGCMNQKKNSKCLLFHIYKMEVILLFANYVWLIAKNPFNCLAFFFIVAFDPVDWSVRKYCNFSTNKCTNCSNQHSFLLFLFRFALSFERHYSSFYPSLQCICVPFMHLVSKWNIEKCTHFSN